MLTYVEPDGTRPRVHFCEERSFDPAEPKSLERIGRDFQVHRYRCTTLLDPMHYRLLVVEDTPNVQAGELRSAMRWRIKDMIDFPVDEAVVDILEIPPAEAAGARGRRSSHVVAARAERVRSLTQLLEQAKFPVSVIDIHETAQRNIAALLESGGRGVVLVSFDEDGGLITLTCGGELYMSRRIDVTADNLADREASSRSASLDRAALEVQRSLDHFERQYSHVTLERCFVGALPSVGIAVLRQRGGSVHELFERLATNLYLPVEPLELSTLLGVNGVPPLATPGGQSRWLKLLGAGLRPEASAS